MPPLPLPLYEICPLLEGCAACATWSSHFKLHRFLHFCISAISSRKGLRGNRSVLTFARILRIAALGCFLMKNFWLLGQNRAIDTERKVFITLASDAEYRHRAAQWSELHRILRDSLPPGIVHFDHEAISFEENADGRGIKVTVAEGGNTQSVKEVEGDFIVAADGSMSRTRQYYVPGDKRRYFTVPLPNLPSSRGRCHRLLFVQSWSRLQRKRDERFPVFMT